jgi:tetratricopeptide (TPR) repeat protein
MKRFTFAFVILLLCAFPLLADEGHHHEDLTAGQLGTVHFPTSCAASVQASFERGIALLHSFWYTEAEKTFAQVAKDDPKCAMAHWGVAMSLYHQLWDRPEGKTLKQGEAEVKKARKLHPPTDRERDYVAAMSAFYSNSKKLDHVARATAYSKAMEQMYQRYSDDREAAAFYALSLLASEPHDDTTFVNRKKAGAVLEKLFTEEPNHAGVAHYLIHTYDKPQLAELGLPAARRYAQIAPAAPHALHMPSHIFVRLGLWQDDIDSNVASIEATRKTAAMHMGDEDHQFHAMDFLVYAYLQNGHEADAKRVIEEVKTMPPVAPSYAGGFNPHLYALAEFPAVYALELHHWDEAAALTLVPNASPANNAITYWARAIGAARGGHAAEARKDIAELESIQKTLKYPYVVEAVKHDIQEASAWATHAEGKNDEAVSTLRAVADKEDSTGEQYEWMSARQMLGDLLLELKRPQEALAEYEADLKRNPNRFNTLYGAAHAAELAGKSEQAGTYYAQLVKNCAGSSSDRPELGRAKSLLAQK